MKLTILCLVFCGAAAARVKRDGPKIDALRDAVVSSESFQKKAKLECPPVLEQIHCEHGNLMDERGCETANCNPAPNTDTKAKLECPPVLEQIHCEHGNLMDERGCETANCNPAPNTDTKEAADEGVYNKCVLHKMHEFEKALNAKEAKIAKEAEAKKRIQASLPGGGLVMPFPKFKRECREEAEEAAKATEEAETQAADKAEEAAKATEEAETKCMEHKMDEFGRARLAKEDLEAKEAKEAIEGKKQRYTDAMTKLHDEILPEIKLECKKKADLGHAPRTKEEQDELRRIMKDIDDDGF